MLDLRVFVDKKKAWFLSFLHVYVCGLAIEFPSTRITSAPYHARILSPATP